MEKKKIIITSITVAMLLFGVVASSYAYFVARIASSGQTGTSVTAKTLDSFVVNEGSDVSIVANQDNFAMGQGDLTASTKTTVTFTARNDAASSSTYKVYLYVKSFFGYSKEYVSEDGLSYHYNNIFSTKRANHFYYVGKYWEDNYAKLYWCLSEKYSDIINYFGNGYTPKNGGLDGYFDYLDTQSIGDEFGSDYFACGDSIGEIDIYTDSEFHNVEHTISADAGATTTDTWEAIVTFKNLDVDQERNIGSGFLAFLQIASSKDFESEEMRMSNYEKCMQKRYSNFDADEYVDDYDLVLNKICNGDETCESQFYSIDNACSGMWLN